MMPIVRGSQQTGTRIMMFNIPNTERYKTHESSDDVFLDEPALNTFYAGVDELSRNTVAESTDMHSVADSISTRTECDTNNCEGDHNAHKEPEMDEKLSTVGCDGECMDHTSPEALGDTSSGDPVVITHLGRVRGRTLDKAHVFYGIPYADPPVGDKRWAPPSPVSPWTYTYDATFPRPACMQVCAGEFSWMCPPKVWNTHTCKPSTNAFRQS